MPHTTPFGVPAKPMPSAAWVRCSIRIPLILTILPTLFSASPTRADILRWDNNQLISGTQGITPGPRIDLSNWNILGHQLEYASLLYVDLTGATLASSDLVSANFYAGTLTRVDFSNSNITGAFGRYATLTHANLSGALIQGADFNYSIGLTYAQLSSTLSFQQKNLAGVSLQGVNLTGGDFSGQNLTGASLSSLTDANLSNANLTSAYGFAVLTNANLNGALIQGANFRYATGFTYAQLTSTLSFQQKNLSGIGLEGIDLTGGDFSGQNLIGANFTNANLSSANFTNADLRGAVGFVPGTGTITTNAILPDGTIQSLTLAAGTTSIIRFSSLAVKVADSLTLPTSSPGTYIAKLDLTDNKLILQTTDAADKQTKIADLNAAITSGANNATWTGNGISSSTAAQDPNHYAVGLFDNAILQKSSFGGQSVDSTSILLTIAHLGDTNDDGIVNIQDVSIVANNWQKNRNNWAQGDLNRDGIVNIQDFSIVANNWQQSSIYSLEPDPGLQITDYGLLASAPEPASLSLLALSALLLTRRKRKQHSQLPLS